MGIDIRQLSPAAQMQIAQKLVAQEKAKQAKYHNVKDNRGSIKFDSKAEAKRYDELLLLAKTGRIGDLKLQPQFTLVEGYKTPEGKLIKATRYVADFSYADQYGVMHVEDVKSKATKTRVYEIKKKLMLEKFGIEIEEIE